MLLTVLTMIWFVHRIQSESDDPDYILDQQITVFSCPHLLSSCYRWKVGCSLQMPL